MGLQDQIMNDIKDAMRAKDSVALESLRAVKAALLLAQTESGAKEAISADAELKLLQKLVKQRKDSAAIYIEQGRADLAEPELAQAAVIEKYLPAQLSESEIETILRKLLEENKLFGSAAMGQAMAIGNKELAGRADGKTIAAIVKKLLGN
jgi:uncharacterized protein YqeY